MSLEKFDPGVLWQRFIELAAVAAIEREAAYSVDGVAFLSSLAASFMKTGAMPAIESPEDFSAFIVELRENYRLWNQRLMSLMIAYKGDAKVSNTQLLQDFIATCPWIELTESAQNFLDSAKD
jgi:hypothetical protein